MNTLELVGTGILGLILGSFFSMLIPRLHHEEKGILTGRSKCPNCKKKLQAQDLIPLLSYLINKAKCRHCKKTINSWYPFSEALTALSFVGLYILVQDPLLWLHHAAYLSVLLFIFLYDLRYKEIHDIVLLPAIGLALVATFFYTNPANYLLGGLIGFSAFALQYFISKGKWIGSGDMRIGAFIGLMLGWQLTLVAIITAYILGSVVGITLLTSKKAKGKSTLPLGPFLVTGSIIAFIWGQNLLEWYLNLSWL